MDDKQFVQRLRDYLSRDGIIDGVEPTVPLFYNSDGSINRERVLGLPCFFDMPAILAHV